MKRLAVFSTAYAPFIGGAELAIENISKNISDAEFVCFTARLRKDLPRREKIGNVLVVRLGIGAAIDKLLLPFTAAWAAWREHRAEPFDLSWVVMASYNGFAALFFSWLTRRQVPMALTLQEGDSLDHIHRAVGILRPLWRKIFSRAAGLQAISGFLLQWGRAEGFGGEIAEVIPNGVALELFQKEISSEERTRLRLENGAQDQDAVIISVSRLVKKNGLADLLRAFSILIPNSQFPIPNSSSSLRLWLVGDGPLRSELEQLARELKIEERVKFFGAVPYEKVPTLLKAADIFCRPSLSEGMGNVFVEAQAAGLPVVGTNIGGIPDVVKDGENGLLAPPQNPSVLAEILRRTMTERGDTMASVERGRSGSTQFDWKIIASRMNKFFEHVIAEQTAQKSERKKIRVLLFTQAVDLDDQVLGFYHDWIKALASRVDTISVICLKRGRFSLPDNVKVFSLGKERGATKFDYLWRVLAYSWGLRKKYNIVYVHMNKEYAVLVGWLWRLMGKRVIFWYAHYQMDILVRLAVLWSNVVLTSTRFACRISSKKLQVVGQAIDTDQQSINNRQQTTINKQQTTNNSRILFLGRISPVKHLEIIIDAFAKIAPEFPNASLTIVGAPTLADAVYAEKMRVQIAALPEATRERVFMKGPVSHAETPIIYAAHNIFVNATVTGSFDKTTLEAMASGSLVAVANRAFEEVLPKDLAARLMFNEGSSDDLSRVLRELMTLGQEEKITLGEKLRGIIAAEHSLNRQLDKIMRIMVKLVTL
ncbi:MAG: 1,2-diacylglycerol 3-glucosyltransferase [Candidatus Magasanikbacteria bacterium]|nr:1,2-diacylglycerol 3-glucosyltransferase [Candidatus Magasanikbacteria bacterium]